jgi:hypothetical protein
LDFLTLEDGTDTLSRNVGKGLPLDVALYSRRAQISATKIFQKFSGSLLTDIAGYLFTVVLITVTFKELYVTFPLLCVEYIK